MEFLRLFKTHAEYEEEKASGLTLPNVSHCIKEHLIAKGFCNNKSFYYIYLIEC